MFNAELHAAKELRESEASEVVKTRMLLEEANASYQQSVAKTTAEHQLAHLIYVWIPLLNFYELQVLGYDIYFNTEIRSDSSLQMASDHQLRIRSAASAPVLRSILSKTKVILTFEGNIQWC